MCGTETPDEPERGIDRHGDVETLVVPEPVEPVKTSGRPVTHRGGPATTEKMRLKRRTPLIIVDIEAAVDAAKVLGNSFALDCTTRSSADQ